MSYTHLEDQDLLQLMAQGQADALSELYDRYNRLVYSLAYNALGDPAAAEEITQDTFLRAWDHAATFQPQYGKVAAWLSGIARNRAIDVYRHQHARREDTNQSLDDMQFFDPPSSQNVERDAEQHNQAERVRRAVAQLPSEQRQALELAFFRGMTHEEIAAALNQPLGTVKTRIRLAMQKLRDSLQQELKV